jgi:hypothetical protein
VVDVDLSPEVCHWIERAGLEMIQGSEAEDGRTTMWNNLGEVRDFINFTDGWFVITSSDRMGPESYAFGANSMTVIELYLYAMVGGSVRSGQKLPPIRTPFKRDELRPGYVIGTTDFAGRERHTLIDATGDTVAMAGVGDLVELSHFLDTTVDVIKASFLAPDGKPLFVLWSEIRK